MGKRQRRRERAQGQRQGPNEPKPYSQASYDRRTGQTPAERRAAADD